MIGKLPGLGGKGRGGGADSDDETGSDGGADGNGTGDGKDGKIDKTGKAGGGGASAAPPGSGIGIALPSGADDSGDQPRDEEPGDADLPEMPALAPGGLYRPTWGRPGSPSPGVPDSPQPPPAKQAAPHFWQLRFMGKQCHDRLANLCDYKCEVQCLIAYGVEGWQYPDVPCCGVAVMSELTPTFRPDLPGGIHSNKLYLDEDSIEWCIAESIGTFYCECTPCRGVYD
jgi:hypothetical protein